MVLLTLFALHSAGDPSYAQATNVTGNWSGTTRVTPPCSQRCDALNNITFRFDQQGNKIKGKYTCAYGNRTCRNGGADSTGKIVSGHISGSRLRFSVVLPADASNCDYSCILMSATTARGAYSCYQGGQIVEQGSWDVQRASAQ
jgi:hypothetical protein